MGTRMQTQREVAQEPPPNSRQASALSVGELPKNQKLLEAVRIEQYETVQTCPN
jgi:hypothetical protein